MTPFKKWTNKEGTRSGLNMQIQPSGVHGTVHFPAASWQNLRMVRLTCGMADVFTVNKLANNTHRVGAIPAGTDWRQWTSLYELIPWDNASDFDDVLKQLRSEQNARNWRTL